MNPRHALAHLTTAYVYANLSYCAKRQVGCVIVKDGGVISYGYNGTPPGDDNICELPDGKTKPTVIHAEDNALRKLTRSTASAEGSTMFVTTCPCEICAARIVDAKIRKVYYSELYKNKRGLEYLASHGVMVEYLPIKPIIMEHIK